MHLFRVFAPLLTLSMLIGIQALAQDETGPIDGPGGPRVDATLDQLTKAQTSSTTATPPAALSSPGMPTLPKAPQGAPAAPTLKAPKADPAWTHYHDAFLDTITGRDMKARRELVRLRTRYPNHPASILAEKLLTRMDRMEFGTSEQNPQFGSHKPTGLARAELAATQTVSGIFIGAWFCGAAGCDDGRIWTAALTLGAAGGLAGSLMATDADGITPGRALAINSGTEWGVYNGAMLAAALDADGKGVFGALLAGQLLGTGMGVAVAKLTDPTAGDVSIVTSGGLWAGAAMFMINGATEFELFDGDGDLWSILIASDLGLLGAALLRNNGMLQMSRSRALLIDSGGLLGTLFGMGLAVMIGNDNASPAGVFIPGLLGMAAGLGGTYYLTDDWDLPSTEMSLAVIPLQDGGMTVGVGGRF